jgi:hypothetical protein
VDVIWQATFTFCIGSFSASYILAKELLKSNHIYIRVKLEYTPIRNNYLNLITERFPGLAFLRVVALRQHAILIGDVSFSLDTNIGLFFDKIGKTMLQQYVFTQEVLFRKQDNITICDNSIPVSRF